MFLGIVFTIIFLQALIVTHGGLATFCYNWRNDSQAGGGLDVRQWLICIGFGFGGIIWSVLLKLFPEERCCPQVKFKFKNKIQQLNSLEKKLLTHYMINRRS